MSYNSSKPIKITGLTDSEESFLFGNGVIIFMDVYDRSFEGKFTFPLVVLLNILDGSYVIYLLYIFSLLKNVK